MPDPSETRLGLLGVNFLSDLKHGFYGGISGYGALRGERGGFFTGGLTGGKTFHIGSSLYVDAGLFVGGGGGGAAPQGGGLMLRAHSGFFLEMDGYRIGASISRVDFPNGDIESDQISMTVDFPFAFLVGSRTERNRELSGDDITEEFGIGKQDIFLRTQNYFPDSSSETTSGERFHKDFQTIGFEFRNYIMPRRYWFMETSGALGGNADGYAEALFGLGYATDWRDESFGVEASISAGGAGGGQVDTGGGAVAKVRIGANMTMAQKYIMALEGSYMETLDGGQFSAFGVGLRAGWRMHAAVRDGAFSLREAWTQENWEIITEHQSYLSPQRKHSQPEHQDVHLASIQFRRYFHNSGWFLTGQAAGAYEGKAGGYASGLVGPGFQYRAGKSASLSFHSALLFGAGGGGGLDVGSGLLVQPVVGLSYRFNPSLKAGVSFGYIWSPDGHVDSHVVGLNVSIPFVLPNNSAAR
ncbi:MAG: hypothetical protein R6V08_05995 [Desulfuromonadales bacterium]